MATKRTISSKKPARFEQLEDRRVLATLIVTLDTDAATPVPDGELTLREAMAYVSGTDPQGDRVTAIINENVDALGVNDTIVFHPDLFDASGELTINLQHADSLYSGTALALYDPAEDVTIDAGAGKRVTLNASSVVGARVLAINSENTTLRNLTLTGGDAQIGLTGDGKGGGLWATESITLEDVWAIDNTAEDAGGGIAIDFGDEAEGDPKLVINGGLYQDNHAGRGGGLALLVSDGDEEYDLDDLEMLVEGVVVGGDGENEGNTATDGAGIYVASGSGGLSPEFGIIAIRDSVVRGNQAGSEESGGPDEASLDLPEGAGGGIFADVSGGRLLIDGVSIVENTAPRMYLNGKPGDDGNVSNDASGNGHGGGIYIARAEPPHYFTPDEETYAIEIVNSTIADNEALSGGGVAIGTLSNQNHDSLAWYYVTIRHSTITKNVAGPDPNGDSLKSFGGGILIAAADWNESDPSHDSPLNPAPGSLTNPLFLDHAVVTENHHAPNSNNPNGTQQNGLTPADVNPYQYSPNIGFYDSDTGFSQGFYDDPFDSLGLALVAPDQPVERINTRYTYLQLDAPVGDPFTEVLAPFNDVLELWDVDANASGVYLSEGEQLMRSEYSFAYGEFGVAYVPLEGGVLDGAGDPSYAQVGNLPDYMLPVADFPVVFAAVGDKVAHDQRDDPYVRVEHVIELGAWELQDEPESERSIFVTDVVLDGSAWGRVPHSYADEFAADTDGVGDQLKPVFTAGVDTISIEFSEAPTIAPDALTLYGSNGVVFDSTTYSGPVISGLTATWTFDSLPDGLASLPSDKYRIDLDATKVTNADDVLLDGDWDNDPGTLPGTGEQTWDDFSDDPEQTEFASGQGVPGGPFVFMFSLLAGDADRNGYVDGADATLGGDVDGDGDTDATDQSLISNAYFGDTLATHRGTYYSGSSPMPDFENLGDYNDDEIVDEEDYRIWRMTYASPTDMRADGNSDGLINAADYLTQRHNRDDYSGWYTGPLPGGQTSGAQATGGAGPQVTNVIISGSQSTHAPHAYDEVAGSGDQLLPVPVGGADTVSIRFSENVNVSADDLTFQGLRTGGRPVLVDHSYDNVSMTATWRFETLAVGDHYVISLSDSVTDVDGDALDGDWTNPQFIGHANATISEFPSGDGTAGGDFVFVTTILPGDINLDGDVDSNDIDIFIGYLMGTSIENASFNEGDFNGDGVVDSLDINPIAANYGVVLNTAISLLADLGGDLDVDSDDADLLFDNFLLGISNPTQSDGDLDGDGDIDVHDYDMLYEQIGLNVKVAV